MKTLKLMIVATLVAFSAVSFANNGGDLNLKNKKEVVYLTLSQAIQSPELVDAMYDQIAQESLFNSGQENSYITAEVVMGSTTFIISGTTAQWKLFFRLQISITVAPGNVNNN